MVHEIAQANLSEPLRKELFHRLVVAQDYAMSVEEARKMVCALFAVEGTQVRGLRRTGLLCKELDLCDVLLQRFYRMLVGRADEEL
jgi:hypothetical protein